MTHWPRLAWVCMADGCRYICSPTGYAPGFCPAHGTALVQVPVAPVHYQDPIADPTKPWTTEAPE